MNELQNREELEVEKQDIQCKENSPLEDGVIPPETCTETAPAPKTKLTKKRLIICGVVLVAIIAIAFAFLYKSEFERVQDEVVQIAGMAKGGKDYFTIDTYPDWYADMDSTVVAIMSAENESNALKAIKYANEELGFNSSLYSKMLETNALMGRQSEENDKYKVSWTYHPDDGLEVTYEKK